MAKINMRDYYPFYEHDEYVEVSDELAAEMAQWERTERSQKRKKVPLSCKLFFGLGRWYRTMHCFSVCCTG